MSTKEQERKALEQIKKIVAGLGNDSYIAMAFEGCFEIAEENIENDFGCSMKQRYESEREKRIEAELGYNRMVDKLKTLEEVEAASGATIASLTAETEKYKTRIAELLEDSKTGVDYIGELNTHIGDAQRRAEEAEAEVIRLKAKLYDYMTAGA